MDKNLNKSHRSLLSMYRAWVSDLWNEIDAAIEKELTQGPLTISVLARRVGIAYMTALKHLERMRGEEKVTLREVENLKLYSLAEKREASE